MTRQIEELFSSLVTEEKVNIISHGVALRLSDLRKRLDLAESRVRHFEKKYGVALNVLEKEGLPNASDFETHEDYIMWHHWIEVVEGTRARIASLEEIARQGIYVEESLRAGR
jgi:hypothetical protein